MHHKPFADLMRKQTANAMQLTVVSTCGLVGTVAAGCLGMNLYSHADLPTEFKIAIFFAVFASTTILAFYMIVFSKRIADFMEAISLEGLTWRGKFVQFRQIWGAEKCQNARDRRDGAGTSSDVNSWRRKSLSGR